MLIEDDLGDYGVRFARERELLEGPVVEIDGTHLRGFGPLRYWIPKARAKVLSIVRDALVDWIRTARAPFTSTLPLAGGQLKVAEKILSVIECYNTWGQASLPLTPEVVTCNPSSR